MPAGIFLLGNPEREETAINNSSRRKILFPYEGIGSGKNRYYGIATFSKFPIVRKGEIIHPGSSSLSIYTDMVIQKDTFRIFNNHLQSFRLKKMESHLLKRCHHRKIKKRLMR